MSEKADFNEYLKDAKLGISTIGRNDRHSDTSKFPYEPTAYSVLDRLADSGYLTDTDCLLDYGCGKGRVPLYLNHRMACRTIGVEIEKDFYEDAIGNVTACGEKYPSVSDAVWIIHAKAQTYDVPEDVTACFFFNPFSSVILKNLMGQILKSVQACPRRILLFFYYPGEAYIAYLARVDQVMFVDEIDCTDLFPEEDSRNRIMIYEINYY